MTSFNAIRGGANPNDLTFIQRALFEFPWHAATRLLRWVYGFRVEGAENLPQQGPFILVNNEHSPIAFMITGWIAIVALKQAFRRNPETISFLREELFDFPFFRSALNERAPGRYAALTPITAGRLALSLLEAYRVLQDGGIVVLNPEGDMPWDGRPLPIGHALAWLGLHTSAPIVPAMITMGAYDIWPRWQPRMNLHGQVRLRIGPPFRLCDAPRERVTDADMAAAEREMLVRFDALRYGPGGVAEWSGVPTLNGKPLAEPFHLAPSAGDPPRTASRRKPAALWRRGIALLLWRCPVCHSDDALLHDRPLLGAQSVRCEVCGTRWRVKHIPGKDFRLEIVAGAPELVGLEMALSAWYDEMKRDLEPAPIAVSGVELRPEEKVFLEARDVALLPRRPNVLLENWNGREPPRLQPPTKAQLAGWGNLGKGRLLLSGERLLWQGPHGELDFWWSDLTSLSLWLLNTMTIRYGAAPYRFELGSENGLKWMAYAGSQARRVAARTGKSINIAPI